MRILAFSQSVDVEVPPEVAFAAACGFDVPSIIKKHWLFPGVESVAGHEGAWSAVGQQRLLHLTDNSMVFEELTEFHPGAYFEYRVFGFTGALKQFSGEGTGVWRVYGDEFSASIIWEYRLRFLTASRPILGPPFIGRGFEAFWPGYMRAALNRLKHSIEAS